MASPNKWSRLRSLTALAGQEARSTQRHAGSVTSNISAELVSADVSRSPSRPPPGGTKVPDDPRRDAASVHHGSCRLYRQSLLEIADAGQSWQVTRRRISR